MKYSIIVGCVALLFSCSEINDFQAETEGFKLKANESDIIISEVSSKSSDFNEFDKKSDWVMLHNSSEETLWLSEGDWTISDDPDDPGKFQIPEVQIASKGNLIIWCDKSKLEGDDIHANFKLSSKGETVTLYYRDNISDQVQYDSTMAENGSFVRVDESQDAQLSDNSSLNSVNK